VEDWLGKVEEAMFVNLRKLVKSALADYEQRPRSEWVVTHASQIVLTVSQIVWCRDVSEVLESDSDRLEGMKMFEQKCFKVRGGSKFFLFVFFVNHHMKINKILPILSVSFCLIM
jgi:hypothetical protein